MVGGMFAACADVEPPGAGGLGVTVHALNTEACSGTTGNGSPFSEVSEVTVVITGTDPATLEYGELVRRSLERASRLLDDLREERNEILGLGLSRSGRGIAHDGQDRSLDGILQ